MKNRILYCDTVTYSKKYMFGLSLHFWPKAPKTIGISLVVRMIKVSFVILIRWLLESPKDVKCFPGDLLMD